MTYATEWNDVYRNNSHMSIWPWSDLVSSVYRYANPRDGYQRVLELGCGAGANIPLFLKENFDYYSIEGSENIVNKLIAIYPELSKKILVGDFTNKNSFLKDNFFDLVVDRGSITCNDTNAITNTLKHVVEYLRPGGKIICIDWYSSVHSDSKTGDYIDAHTRTNLPADSHLNGIGKVHFSDKEHILELFKKSDLIIEKLEHKEKSQELPNNKIHFASWDIIARKPV